MAPKVNIGDTAAQVSAAVADMTTKARPMEELDRKIKDLKATEESEAAAERTSADVRNSLATATEKLTGQIGRSTTALTAETGEWEANTEALRENLRLRREIGTVITSGGTRAAPVESVATPASRRGARVAPAPVPIISAAEVQASRDREVATAIAAEQARNAVTQARRAGGTPETVGPLVQQRADAVAAASAARSTRLAMEKTLQAQEADAAAVQAKAEADARAAVQANQQQLAALSSYNQAQAAAWTAGARAQAPMLAERAGRIEAAGQAVSGYRPPLALPPGRPPPLLPPGPPVALGGSPEEGGGSLGGGVRTITQEFDAAAAAQGRFSTAVNAAGVAYAQSSNALSRHGALTTEFIQALARGDVTLQEFGSQMVSTIGKFGGWLVAGAALFGVLKIFEDIKKGAADTQNAITTLGRFIPGLGGPAGGGSGQVPQAEANLRNLSTQLNVPISQVADSMQVVARVFHNLGDATTATHAVLAATKLDQVPTAQATQYLLGISQAEGWTSGGQVEHLMDSLNALQSRYGARVSQTLPALARAAPAALAGGVGIDTLNAMIALGVRAGIPGPQLGTALTRTLGNYAFRGGAQELFSAMGIQPSTSSVEGPLRAIFGRVAIRSEEGRPYSQQQLRGFSATLSSQALGSRNLLPIFEEINKTPQLWQQILQTSQHPPPLQSDLTRQLQTVSERFQSIAISLGNFGSTISHLTLEPVTLGIGTVHTFVTALTAAATPLAGVGELFRRLPGPLQELVVAVVGAVAAYKLYQNTFVGTAAQNFAGRLAFGSEWQESSRSILRQRTADLRNVLQPQAQSDLQSARLRRLRSEQQLPGLEYRQALYEQQMKAAGVASGQYTPEGVGIASEAYKGTDLGAGYEKQSATYLRQRERTLANIEQASMEEEDATYLSAQLEHEIALMKGQIRTLTGERMTAAERAAVMEGYGFTAPEGQKPADLAATFARQAQEKVATMRGEDPAVVATKTMTDRIKGVGDDVKGFAGTVKNFFTSGAAAQGLPFAALIGSQMLPLPGGIQTAIGGVAGGALAGQFLGGGAKGIGIGATLGALATSFQQGQQNGQGGATDAAITGAATAVGAVVGSFTPVGPFGGAAIGSGLATLGEAIFGGTKQPDNLAKLAQKAAANESNVQKFGDTFSNNLTTAFSGTSTAATNAQNLITKQMQDLQARALLLGPDSQQGKEAIKETGQVIGAALGIIDTNFSGAAQVIQGAFATTQSVVQRYSALLKYQYDPKQIAALSKQAYEQLADQNPPPTSGPAAGMSPDQMRTAIKNTTDQIAADSAATVQAHRQGLYRRVQSTKYEFHPEIEGTMAGAQLGPVAGHPNWFNYGGGIVQVTTATQEYIGKGKAPDSNIDQLRTKLAGLTKALHETVSTNDLIDAFNEDARKQIEQLVITNVTQPIATAAQLAAARTTDPVEQARIQLRSDTEQLKRINNLPQFRNKTAKQLANDQEYQQQRANLDTNAQQQREAIGQGFVAKIQAASAVTEADVPSVDPVRRATVALQGTADVYKYMADHVHEFSGVQIKQALANWKANIQGLADATYSVQSETISAAETLGEARANEDPSVIARVQLRAGRHMLAIARNRPQRLQARAMIANAGNASIDASRTWSDDQQALAEARAHGDAGLIAAAQRAGAIRDLHLARNPYQRSQALAKLAQANTAGVEAARSTAQAQTGLTQAQDYGDAVKQADDAVRGANRQLSLAQTSSERLGDLATVLNDQHQKISAISSRQVADAQLLASGTADPVKQAYDIMVGADKALATAIKGHQGKDTIHQLKTTANTATASWRQAQASQIQQNVDFAFQMMQIPASAAVSQLEDALKKPLISPAAKQQIKEDILRYQLGLNTPIGGGQLDLAPGNIRLPTFYDVLHGVGRAGRPSMQTRNAINASTQINVYVAHSNDVPKVAEAIGRATNSHLKQKLRAAGVTR